MSKQKVVLEFESEIDGWEMTMNMKMEPDVDLNSPPRNAAVAAAMAAIMGLSDKAENARPVKW